MKKDRIIYFLTFSTICVLSLTLFSFQCEKGLGGLDLRLKVKNNSSKSIYFVPSMEYPATNIPGYPPLPDPKLDPKHFKLSPGARIPIYLRDSWEHVASEIPERKIIFFFFDAQVLESTDWDTIRKNNMYIDRKILTLDSIKKMNWTVSYP